jgi:hypothetical protein
MKNFPPEFFLVFLQVLLRLVSNGPWILYLKSKRMSVYGLCLLLLA